MKSIIKNYWSLFNILSARRRKQFLYLQLLSFFAAICETINIGSLIPFLGVLADSNQSIDNFSTYFSYIPKNLLLPLFGLVFVSLIIISTIVKSITIRFQYRLGALITADLGETAYNSILNNPFEWHLSSNSSSVISLLTQDVDNVAGIMKILLMLSNNFLIISTVGLSLFFYSPFVVTLALASIGLYYILIFRIFRRDFRKDGQERLLLFKKCIQIVQESLGGIRELILGDYQESFVKSYDFVNRKRTLTASRILINATIPRYLIEGFIIIFIATISLAYVYLGNDLNDILPLLGAISLGAYKLMQPVQQCFSSISLLQSNQASLNKYNLFVDVNIENKSNLVSGYTSNESSNQDDFSPLITFKNVSYRYPSTSKLVLQNIDLTVMKGERIAIVGFTGSGKTTFADLALGLLKPTEGSISVNGDDIDLHNKAHYLRNWQKCVSHVPQHIFLSDSDFESNIAFCTPSSEVNQKKLKLSASQAHISSLIEDSENGYQTIIGEHGVTLSGGQRQRIGIARALYRETDLLILDEATSALDNFTEQAVMTSIKKLHRGITMIVIAHRLSTIRYCDRIIVLDKGKINGIGSYDFLVNNNSVFNRLVNSNCNDNPLP